MQHYSCHTWIYKKIDAITEDELINFIDSAINERKSRSYMQCDSKEFAIKLKKIANTSSGDEICKYRDIKEGITRYDNAVDLNNKMINLLIKAKENKDYSILTNKCLFEHHPILENYIFFDIDNPFVYCGYTQALYTKPSDIITFLWKCNNEFNRSHILFNDNIGMSKELEHIINNLFLKHNNNILIEFAP